MGNFDSGFWNLFIIVIVLGGIIGLFLLTARFSTARASPEEKAESTGHVWDEDLRELNNPLPHWWVNLFYITLAFGALYLMLYPGLGSNRMFLGWTEITQYQQEMKRAQEKYGPIFAKYAAQPIEALAKDPAALRIGERLFASYCTVCHGSDAGGGPGFPNLRDHDWLWGGSPQTIETTILKGRTGVMPAWKAALGGEAGVKQVAQYVLTLSGRKADPAAAAAGKAKFEQICFACHGRDGKGNQALGAPNLTDDVWLFGGSLAAIENTIANGRKSRMPAHEDFLGKDKVHLLAAYVWSLSNR